MALLTEEAREAVLGEFMRDDFGEVVLTKPDLRAAVEGLDDYLNANLASINQSIPQPARGVLTTAQKVWLFKRVLDRRFKDGSDS